MAAFCSLPVRGVRRGSGKEDRGGYDCQLVNLPPSHIQTECSVCLQILKEPCIVSCCGHKFCRECIEPVVEAGKDCPLCNQPGFSFMREQSLDRALLDFDVFCSAQGDGCEWTGKLRKLEHHLNRSYSPENQLSGCQFVEVECVYPQCGVFLQRRHIAAHQTEQCMKRPYTCEYCQVFVSVYDDIKDNHYKVCGLYPVTCPNLCSNLHIKRQGLQQHLRDECPLTVIQCPFHYTGCLVTATRHEMFEHSQDIATHFMLLSTFTLQLAHENRELRSRIEHIEKESVRDRDNMLERISKLSTACCISNHHIKHREMMDAQDVSSHFFAESMNKISRQVILKITEMEIRSMYFALLPYEFKIENFLNYKQGPVEYSPIYYSHPFGYKFRIKVFRTEYLKVLSLDAFTSIYVELLPGPYDYGLCWPFKGSLTIAIVNQLSDSHHFEKMVRFSDKPYQKGKKLRPESGSNIIWGYKPFIYHKEMRYEHCKDGHRIHLLKDGSLSIRVTDIKLSS